MGGVRTPEEREDDASYRSSTGQGEKGGDLDLAEGEPFRRRFGPQWKRGEEVCMTKSARRVQNSGVRVEKQPFMASKAVMLASIPQVPTF